MGKTLAEKEMELASTFLNDEELLFGSGGSARSIVSRVYYAGFHAARSVLVKFGFEPKTHRGTIHLFFNEVAKKNLCSIESAKLLSRLYKEREEADYDIILFIDKKTIEKRISDAKKFIEEMREIILKNPI